MAPRRRISKKKTTEVKDLKPENPMEATPDDDELIPDVMKAQPKPEKKEKKLPINKIADIEVPKDSVVRMKWIHQVLHMPRALRDKMKVTIQLRIKDLETGPQTCNVGEEQFEIPREVDFELPMAHFLHLSFCSEMNESNSWKYGSDGKPKRKSASVSQRPYYPMDVVQDENYEFIQASIRQYIQDVG